jgi:hypothetical protein
MLHHEEFHNYTDNVGPTVYWIVTHRRARRAGHEGWKGYGI